MPLQASCQSNSSTSPECHLGNRVTTATSEALPLSQNQNAELFQRSLAVVLSEPAPVHLHNNHGPASHYCGVPSVQNDGTRESTTRPTTEKTVEHSAQESSLETPERFWFRCAGAFFALFTAGWADGVTGTILPHIKNDFELSYIMSSLLFVTSTFGFALGVIMIEQVMCLLGSFQLSRIGLSKAIWFRSAQRRRKITRAMPSHCFKGNDRDDCQRHARARFRILVIGSLFHASFFVLMGTATGLSNVLIAYFIASLGKAFLNGTVNAYVAASPRRPLGQMYACNSIGAFAAPFVCQTLLARGIPWSHFYLGSLILSAMNTGLLALSFRPTRNERTQDSNCSSTLDGAYIETRMQSSSFNSGATEEGSPTRARSNTAMSEKSMGSKPWPLSASLTEQRDRSALRLALRLRYIWAFSFFMCIYSGSETATQGYMATYLLAVRNANPNTVGYVTSGFWAGMAITRFITGFASPYLSFTQRKHAIHIILICALSMHLCIWFINSVFENAFSTGIVGLLYGPVYPSVLALAVDLLPKEAHMITMAIIAGFSNLGSSIFPFIAGAMSNLRGPKVLVYMTVAQTVTLIVLWMFFPAKSPLHH
ncbi:MFS general substrate transporter [Fomitiporia mediterranea MF3/22]|uniref:MFS general substrate transporter n=1 Tax=Fomitiporia mediterranea (strain MF3/22) TaxID=694068 RepID=UPI0004408D2E|nr:MFS general substrate transporter [Fomitiporia mediterranea MF3/22]EJD04321.1 MFS general substrate transporter [Fomitiporia mediterranea MF3/22]